MTGRQDKNNLIEGFPKNRLRIVSNPRRPFWVYASSYYIFAVAVSIATFFLVWGILLGNAEDTPWIPSGVVASLVLIFAVVLREFLLRRLQRQIILRQGSKEIDYNRRPVYHRGQNLGAGHYTNKLTLERNAAIINSIESKSKAARSLEKLPEAHLEVFEMCNEYLQLAERELETTGISATRLVALRRGREKVQSFHRYHLLAWASITSNLLIQDAKVQILVGEKLENAQRSMSILETAVQYYPAEKQIIDSMEAVKEFIVSIRVSHWIEQAERAAFKENYKRAINHYRDALFFLARENERTPERDLVAEKINSEIEKLRELLKNNPEKEMLPPATNKKKR